MLAFANAKINIGLNVVEKRLDGFHNLETVFYPVNIFDSIEIVESESLQFFSYGLTIPGDVKDNLCLKAYQLIKSEYDIPAVEIHLLKNIPFGAGLGGGSSDAAQVLKMLDQKFELNLGVEKLESLAVQLGSDCPFFIKNVPQYAEGRGEILQPIDLDLQKYTFALIKPNFSISTKEAFSGLKPKPSSEVLKFQVTMPVQNWKSKIKNDFEESLFPKFPELEEIKKELYRRGALYASLSGSGSTLYGIFEPCFQNKFEALGRSEIFWI